MGLKIKKCSSNWCSPCGILSKVLVPLLSDYPNIELITKVIKKGSSVLDVNNMTNEEKDECNKSNRDYARKLYKIASEINLAFIKF